MPALFSNNASATLASSISTSSTSITVSTGMGALFPTITAGTYFYATLTDSSNNLEIVKVTGRTSDSLTVVRAQEGTTARAYAAADKIELRITAAVLGNLVQLDGAQTITGVKTFSGANAYGTPNSITLTNATGLPVATGISGLGTGIATALAVNVGSAGAPVVNGGALGTPASGNLANCTFPTVPASASVSTTNFTIEQSGSNLVFKYNGATVAQITSTGVITSMP